MRYHDYPRSVHKPILNGQLAPVGWGGVDQYDFRWEEWDPVTYYIYTSHLHINEYISDKTTLEEREVPRSKH